MQIKNKTFVSIIVPIYNAERHLKRCIDSIVSQTFKDFELLLINDGSKDNSGYICDEYSDKDTRIRVFHNPNMGVSRSRQFGIDNAIGDYTIHVDSDDWIEPNMLEVLYNEISIKNADIIICDFFINKGDNYCIIQKQKPTSTNNQDLLSDLFRSLHGSLCNKLIKRSCYSDIRFPEDISLCEDLYVVCSILKNDVKVAYIPQAFYHYVQDANNNSITKTAESSYEYDVFLLERFSELLKDNPCINVCRNKFMFDIIARAYDRNNFTSSEFRNKCAKYSKAICKKNISAYYRFKLYLSCIGLFHIIKLIDNIKR